LPIKARLVVTDLNDGMLDIARSKLSGAENVEFAPADAMALPFSDHTFDLVTCQFGVMFFPDKIASFREAHRVLQPGGRYVFNTWSSMPENPFSEVAHQTAVEFFPANPPSFYRVPFSYADANTVAAEVKEGGFTDVAVQALAIQKTVSDWAAFAHGLVFGN
jgi:ubiquinone/menaquinone biosynthesis C-methylase UbiE